MQDELPPQGWYPHMGRQGYERWWTGREWTDRVRKKRSKGKRPRPEPTPPPSKARPLTVRAEPARETQQEKQRKIVCTFCQQSGHVTTAPRRKKGPISGAKATGAILTGGVSLLATGLARKNWVVTLECSNCGMSWDVQS